MEFNELLKFVLKHQEILNNAQRGKFRKEDRELLINVKAELKKNLSRIEEIETLWGDSFDEV